MQYNEVVVENKVENKTVNVENKRKDHLIQLEELTDCGKNKSMKDEEVISLIIDLNKEGISLLDRKR